MLNIGGWQNASSDLADMDEGGIFVIKIGCAISGDTSYCLLFLAFGDSISYFMRISSTPFSL